MAKSAHAILEQMSVPKANDVMSQGDSVNKDKKKEKKSRKERDKRDKKERKQKGGKKRTAEESELLPNPSSPVKQPRRASAMSVHAERDAGITSGEQVNGCDTKFRRKSAEKDAFLDDDVEDRDLWQHDNKANELSLAVDNFNMSSTTVSLLKKKGIESLFEIQAATYSVLRNEKKDVIGRARTGSGKTLAFVLPIIESIVAESKQLRRASEKPIVLVLAPTRELAQQVHSDFEYIGNGHRLSTACFYGGTPKGPQKGALRHGLDILVGTPGRILDHMEEGRLILDYIEYVVLDEADEMLSMGFQEDVEKILSGCKSPSKQMLLFSATVPRWVLQLARKYMRPDATVRVDTTSDDKNRTNSGITHYGIACPWNERPATLADIIMLHCGARGKALIFTETKAEANELAEHEKLISALGGVGVLHGDIPQAQRERTLKSYRIGRVRALVATDVAARGLDIQGVDLVLQTHPPVNYETYIHRSGRTGRAGKQGKSVLFYTPREKYLVGLIEYKAGIKFKRASPPQAVSIVKSNVPEIVEKISSVHPANVKVFKDAAACIKTALPDSDNETLLAAALACMAGHGSEQIKSRSLLSCFEGWLAVKMTCRIPLESSGHAWSIARRVLGPEIASEIKGMTLCKDRSLAVFDIPQKHQNRIAKLGKQEHCKGPATLDIPEAELPELEDDDFDLHDAQRMLLERRAMDFQRRSGRKTGGWRSGRSNGRKWSGNGHLRPTSQGRRTKDQSGFRR